MEPTHDDWLIIMAANPTANNDLCGGHRVTTVHPSVQLMERSKAGHLSLGDTPAVVVGW